MRIHRIVPIASALFALYSPIQADEPEFPSFELYMQQVYVGSSTVVYTMEGVGPAMWTEDEYLTDVDSLWNPGSVSLTGTDSLMAHGWNFMGMEDGVPMLAAGLYRLTCTYSYEHYFYIDFRDDSLTTYAGISPDIVVRYSGNGTLIARGTNPTGDWYSYDVGDTIRVWELKRGASEPHTDLFQPTDPTSLSVSNSDGHPLLSWSPSEAPASTKYYVFSRRGDSGSFDQVTTIALTSTSYLDERFSYGGSGWTQQYKVRAISADLSKWSDEYTNTLSITVGPSAEKAFAVDSRAPRFTLEQNMPNPFNPTTQIRFQLPTHLHVRLAVYSLIGQVVAVLMDGYLEAGEYDVRFNAASFPSGLYVYRLEAGAFISSRKLLLLR